MKSTIKVLVSALALALAASSPALRAQDDSKAPPAGGQQRGQRGQGGRGGGRGGMSIEAIETAVGTLTADQKTKITALLDKVQKDRQALMSGGQPDRAKMQELMTNLRKDVRAVLTEEQATKFDAMAQGGGRRGQGGAGGGRKKQQN